MNEENTEMITIRAYNPITNTYYNREVEKVEEVRELTEIEEMQDYILDLDMRVIEIELLGSEE